MKKFVFLLLIPFFLISCSDNNSVDADLTGQAVNFELIPGNVQGNQTTGTLIISERNDGSAQIDIELQNIIKNANHPVHLHFGSLNDDESIATILNPVIEENGVGKSSTILTALEDGTPLQYDQLMSFDGSIRIHFEASGPLEDEVMGSTNIGVNAVENDAYLEGIRSITNCNSNF